MSDLHEDSVLHGEEEREIEELYEIVLNTREQCEMNCI